MALTPVGPFCPFRSSAAIEMEPRMESMNGSFQIEMAKVQLDMQMGQMPDPNRLRNVAKVCTVKHSIAVYPLKFLIYGVKTLSVLYIM